MDLVENHMRFNIYNVTNMMLLKQQNCGKNKTIQVSVN